MPYSATFLLIIDEGDYQNGICLVAVGGVFTGGEISFPELKMKFDVQPGDVIAFRSYLLLHEVLKTIVANDILQ
jgi:hypothetical protein